MSGTAPTPFAACGVEIEYMIVDAASLDVRPLADRVLAFEAGEVTNEVARGDLAWSNELALHVIELKTPGPMPDLHGLAARFQEEVERINGILAGAHARLMPAAMHPWMDPLTETRLWPHGNNAIYEAYDRIFHCQGHGWSNLQSVHLNLGFTDDESFGRVLAALRLILPLIPAIAASSPVVEGRRTAALDNRLLFYRQNQQRLPFIAGNVIPEPFFSREAYEREILAPMYRDIAPFDPEGLLQEEWLNSRGVIARFERSAFEVRVIDVQECPAADLAVSGAVMLAAARLMAERWSTAATQKAMADAPLVALFGQIAAAADEAVVDDAAYLKALGLPAAPCRAIDVWRHLLADFAAETPDAAVAAALEVILRRGPLARRILAAVGPEAGRDRLHQVYGELCDCLAAGRVFG